MASGIRDKVVILGMGCSRFGERWEAGADDLMLEAFAFNVVLFAAASFAFRKLLQSAREQGSLLQTGE